MSEESVFPVGDSTYDAIYAEESAMVDASEVIASALEASGMTRTDLARALGVSKSEVTARLTGERNITVRKLAATLHALGARLELSGASRRLSDSRRRYSAWTTPERFSAQSVGSAKGAPVTYLSEWTQPARAI